jgi:hypothetical protein
MTNLFLEGQNWFFSEEIWFQTNEQQRRFNEWPIRELLGEVDSIQTNLKLLFASSNNGMSSASMVPGLLGRDSNL